MNKKQLEIILSKLKSTQKPKPSLEQYTIPSDLAAEILNLATISGDIEGKVVYDLGCGTGRLALGALLMGAKEVVAVDADDAVIDTAEENMHSLFSLLGGEPFNGNIKFVCSEIAEFTGKCDTVIQNPPFGIQKANADRVFLEKALECGNKVYTLHKNGYEKTREFISNFVSSRGGRVDKIMPYKFMMPHTFKFHDKPRKEISVDLYVIAK